MALTRILSETFTYHNAVMGFFGKLLHVPLENQ